jgi:hypothetical protein
MPDGPDIEVVGLDGLEVPFGVFEVLVDAASVASGTLAAPIT